MLVTTHYDSEHEKYKGLFLKENNGFVVSMESNAEVKKMISQIRGGMPLLRVISSSPRIEKDGFYGAKFHFRLCEGLKLKFADESQISLIRELKKDTSSLLSLQLKKNRCFMVFPGEESLEDLIAELKFEPIVISLSAPKFTERNANEFWHANPSFRISASKSWLIERPRLKKAG